MSFEKEFESMHKIGEAEAAFHHAMGMIVYDAETAAPEASGEGRGRTLAFLGDLEYEMMTDPELDKDLKTLEAHKDEFSDYEKREIELTIKKVGSVSKIPKDEYIASLVLQDEATTAWKKAKASADFSIFEPYLTKIVEYNRKLARWVNPDMKPYDALLDLYEVRHVKNFFLSGEAHANAFTGSDRTHIAFFHVRYHPCQLLETTVTAQKGHSIPLRPIVQTP